MWDLVGPAGTFGIIAIILIISGIKILKEYERVVFRSGAWFLLVAPALSIWPLVFR